MKLLKKATIKDVLGATAIKSFRTMETETPIVRFAGVARAKSIVATPHGESIKFTGVFATTNLLTGEEGRAVTLYLPAPVDALLAEEIDKHPDNASVEFAFDITVEPRESSSTGYVYNVKTLIDSRENDPLSGLLGTLPTAQLAAPAPAKAEPEVAPQAEAEAAPAGKGKAGK